MKSNIVSLTDIAIDFGTSSGKVGVFRGEDMIEKIVEVGLKELGELLQGKNPGRVIACSVSHKEEDIRSVLSGYNFTYLNADTKLPFELSYTTPATLGTDRIAAVAGAKKLFPGKNCLVIDAGSCITYEVLTSEGKYLGGAISPGINMKFKSLNTFTASLPLLERAEEVELTGKSTREAILSGVIYGTIAEIREIIRMYRNKLPDLQLVICGGDTGYLAERLDPDIYRAPDLVLSGLINILNYNDK